MGGSSVDIYGKRFQLTRTLKPKELDWIDSNLGLYKKVVLTIFGDVDIAKTKPRGWSEETPIALVKKGKATRLEIRRASGNVRWDG